MKKILIFAAMMMVAMSCTWGSRSVPEPEETVKAFYGSLCNGEFDKAESMCDTLMMREYMTGVQKVWTDTDSSVVTILPAILSEILIEVTDVVKNGQERTIFYELTAPDGTGKEKIATLKKEEGAWKIYSIIDRH